MSSMTRDELDLAVAEVINDFKSEGMRRKQQGQDEGEVDKACAQWLGRVYEADVKLRRTCTDGGNLDTWWCHLPAADCIAFEPSTATKGAMPYYTEADSCGCPAYEKGNGLPCWHRAAFRIIRVWQRQTQDKTRRLIEKAQRQQTITAQPRRSMAELQAAVDDIF